MSFRLWSMRVVKACAVLSASLFYRRHGRSFSPPVLVDIGARGGIQRKWREYRRMAPLQAILVEADSDEARRLQNADPQAKVIDVALGEHSGTATLYRTSDPGCSSLFPPTARAQALPDLGYRLQVVGTTALALERGDAVFARQGLPPPDFLKLDTQGTELAILKGFGALLDRVVGIEMECEFLELYQGQPLITEVAAFLGQRDFALLAVRPNGVASHGIVDGNAFFLRRETSLNKRQQVLAGVWRRLNRIPSHFSYVIDNG